MAMLEEIFEANEPQKLRNSKTNENNTKSTYLSSSEHHNNQVNLGICDLGFLSVSLCRAGSEASTAHSEQIHG